MAFAEADVETLFCLACPDALRSLTQRLDPEAAGNAGHTQAATQASRGDGIKAAQIAQRCALREWPLQSSTSKT